MVVLNLRRGHHRRQTLLHQFGAELIPPTPFAMPHLDRDRLKQCVQNLNERERTVVVLSFYNEETGADVANFLGVSEGNVRVDTPQSDSPVALLHGGKSMNCSHPIDPAILADYWVGALAPPEEEAVEEHLLGCDLCGTRLREVIALADGVEDTGA